MLRLLVLVVLPCLCRGQGDSTLTPGARGPKVVEASIDRVEQSCIFNDDKLFIRRLAFVESLDGLSPKTYRDKYDGGIWQVDESVYDGTKGSDSYLRKQKNEISKFFNIIWDATKWEDLRKPLYSCIAARLYFGYETKSLRNGFPRSISDQAAFWRSKYRNDGDVNVFKKRAATLETGCKTSPGVDLSFVLDGSGSIGASNFVQIKRFVQSVIRAFNVTIDGGTSKVSVIQYSSRSRVEFYFNKYTKTQQIVQAVDNIRYMGGGTATNLALDQMTREVFNTANGARDPDTGHPRVGIVLTDGESNNIQLTKTAAERAHAKDIILFSVGVGTSLNQKELEYIASDPVCLHLFELKDGFKEVDSLKSAIIKRTCNVPIPPFVPANDSKEINVRPNIEIKCKVQVPKEGATVKILAREGSVTYYIAEKAYPNEAFYQRKVVATPDKQGVIFIPRSITINLDFLVFCSIKANNQTANISIAVRKNNTDWCRPQPCKNDADCVDLGRSGYRCICLPGYTGKHCETEINFCKSNPCVHGSCEREINGYTCRCLPGYTGRNCEQIIDNCQPNPCKSGAKCHNAVNTFTCICPPGKKGKLCEDDETPGYDCVTKNPCTEENRKKRIFYFPHTNPHNFVQCDNFGRCFVMPCPAGLVWHKRFRTCVRPGTE